MAIYRDIYNIEKISKGPYDIWKINERLEATMYLVCGSEKACMIDTAYGLTDLKELTAELTGLPVSVINTHGHIDHVFGNRWFEHAMIHPADQALYQEAVDGFEKLVSRDWVREAYGQYLRDLDLSTVRFGPQSSADETRPNRHIIFPCINRPAKGCCSFLPCVRTSFPDTDGSSGPAGRIP